MTKTILVSDDDACIRMIHERALTKEGYTMHSFRNGLEAYNSFDKNQELFDLVLTDFEMPIMGGDGLIEKIRAQNEKIPIILFSGLLEDEVKKKYPNPKYDSFMQKPFEIKPYLAKIQEYLNSDK